MKKVLSMLIVLCLLMSMLTSLSLSASAAKADIAPTGSQDGKVLYVFGDSIAEGFLQTYNYVDSWVKYVIDINDYKADPNGKYKLALNHDPPNEISPANPEVSQMLGESGLGFVTKGAWGHYYNYFLNSADFSYADIVVVALGINDWKASNISVETFFNQMKEVFTKIRTDNPGCELYYLLPFNAGYAGSYNNNYLLNFRPDSDTTKTNGYTLSQFCTMIKNKFANDSDFAAYHAHIIDMTECQSINRDTIRDGALYTDNLHPNATTQANLGNEIAPILEHHANHLEEHYATDPSCETAGNTHYWSCNDCGKAFSDANAQNEITEADYIIPPTGHNWRYESEAWTNDSGNDAIPSDPSDAPLMNCKVTFRCGTCYSFSEVDADISISDYQAATCTVDGSVTYTATATCGNATKETSKTYTIAAKGHVPSEEDDLYEYVATTIYNGKLKQVYPCAVCGEMSYGSEIDATHQDSQAPTCTAAGMYECCYSGRNPNRIYYKLDSIINSTKIYKKVSGVADIRIPATGHTLTAHPAVAATCTAAGNSAYWSCDVCGKYFSNANGTIQIDENSWVINATGHDLTAHPAVAATCTTPGNSAYWSCSSCHKYFSDANGSNEINENSWVINATGHNLTAHPAVAATCTTPGNSAYWSCSSCHKYFSDANGSNEIDENSWVINATGHNLTAHPAVAATCTTAGNSAYWSCSSCHKYFSDANGSNEINENSWVINATGHDLTAHPAVAATPTTAGNSAYWSCSECHKYFSDANGENEIEEDSWIIPATGHTMTTHPAVAATCTTAGNSAYWSCSCCNKFYSDANGDHEIDENSWVIPATGHNLTAHSAVAATCTTPGSRAYWSCSSCHKYFSDANGNNEIDENSWIIPANGHDLTAHPAVIATCTTAGNSAYWSCSSCHKYFSDANGENEINENSWVIPATGHTWTFSDWDWNGEFGSTVPTLVGGYYEYTMILSCANCTEKAHVSVSCNESDATLTPATCTESGSLSVPFTAEKDGQQISNTFTWPAGLDPLEHEFDPDSIVWSDSDPVRTRLNPYSDTYYYYVTVSGSCSRCHESIDDRAIVWETNVTVVDATCTHGGYKEAVFTFNNSSKTYRWDETSALPHDLTAHPAVTATCGEAGNSAYWSCNDCHKYFSDANGSNEINENSWVIPATGNHTFSQRSWTWTGSDADGYTAATLVETCPVCSEQQSIPAVVTKSYTYDSTIYTAKATGSDGQVYTDTKTVSGQVYCTGYSISLKGDIGVNFYWNLTPEQAANAVVTFTYNVAGTEKTRTVNLNGVTPNVNGYKSTCAVAPAEMTYQITAVISINGEEKQPYVYSAKQYANYILTDTGFINQYITQYGQEKYNTLVELIHSMLDYGSRAQIRFDRNKDNLANGGVYTYTDPVTPEMIPETMSDMNKDLSACGLEYTGSTVVLLSNTSIRHYYRITNQAKYNVVKNAITFNGSAVTHTENNDEIYFELPDITARNLDTVYKIRIGGKDYSYSVMDYARGRISDPNANVNTVELVKAMYYYNQKANAYFGEPNVEPEHYEWNQTSATVRSFLTSANYDPSDYSYSVIKDFAPADRSLSDERPIGYTFNIKQAGTLTIGDYSQPVNAGNFTAYNVIPNSNTTFTVTDGSGKILQWGTLNPTHFLRQIKSPESRNVRDLGGWACDGGTVKYGKIIRGGAVTGDDREVIVNQLGIRTDIELRSKANASNDYVGGIIPTSSALGEDIDYHIYDTYAWYTFTNKTLCKQIIGDIFDSVQNDKPVYMHCHAGADRTGTIAFILEAILGLSQSDMDMDYELTAFYTGSNNARLRTKTPEGWLSMINEINSKSGATFRDKAVKCVLDLGFTIDEINAFRAKMIDGTPEILTTN